MQREQRQRISERSNEANGGNGKQGSQGVSWGLRGSPKTSATSIYLNTSSSAASLIRSSSHFWNSSGVCTVTNPRIRA